MRYGRRNLPPLPVCLEAPAMAAAVTADILPIPTVARSDSCDRFMDALGPAVTGLDIITTRRTCGRFQRGEA